jgi:formate hydrogenlyase subunit 6/NADH:ubiquinone oxidoreductase subunit I
METPQMSPDFIPQINPARCIGCELCVRLCPTQALSMVDDLATVANPEACNYSGICQEICPTEAISLLYEIVF